MGSEVGGNMWFNVPMIAVESYANIVRRVGALESTVSHLEDLLLAHRRDAEKHVSRETPYQAEHRRVEEEDHS